LFRLSLLIYPSLSFKILLFSNTPFCSLNMYAQSFLVVALCIFDVSLVTARPRERRSSTPVAVPENLNTNAKRFAAGLPPLSPLRRWVGSKVDSAYSQLNTFSYDNCSFPAARRQAPSSTRILYVCCLSLIYYSGSVCIGSFIWCV